MNRLLATLLLAANVVLLGGCSGAQPMDYSDSLENPPGPGLFTGEDGKKTISLGAPLDRSSP